MNIHQLIQAGGPGSGRHATDEAKRKAYSHPMHEGMTSNNFNYAHSNIAGDVHFYHPNKKVSGTMAHEPMELHDAKNGKAASWRMGNNKNNSGTDRTSLDSFFKRAHGKVAAAGLTPKDIGTCEKHMGQHKKRKDCRLWKTIAPAHVPWPKTR